MVDLCCQSKPSHSSLTVLISSDWVFFPFYFFGFMDVPNCIQLNVIPAQHAEQIGTE